MRRGIPGEVDPLTGRLVDEANDQPTPIAAARSRPEREDAPSVERLVEDVRTRKIEYDQALLRATSAKSEARHADTLLANAQSAYDDAKARLLAGAVDGAVAQCGMCGAVFKPGESTRHMITGTLECEGGVRGLR